jgi:hypothetical protein
VYSYGYVFSLLISPNSIKFLSNVIIREYDMTLLESGFVGVTVKFSINHLTLLESGFVGVTVKFSIKHLTLLESRFVGVTVKVDGMLQYI